MKTYIKNNLEAIIEELETMNSENLVTAHNQYCEHNNDMDSQIFHNDEEFFEIFLPNSVDAIRACQYGDHRYTDTFVQFNGYANLESFHDPINYVDIQAIAEDILDTDAKDYFNIELEEDED
jgi:hypothetical protein